MQNIDLSAAMIEIEGDVEFIRIFTRIEYALKVKFGKNDWPKLSKNLGEDFYITICSEGLVPTFLS